MSDDPNKNTPPQGDKTVALKQERERRKALQEELERVTVQRDQALKTAQDAAASKKLTLDLTKLGITQEDLDGGNVAAINLKIQEGLQKVSDEILDKAGAQIRASVESQAFQKRMRDEIAKWDVFSHPSADIAAGATAAAVAAIQALPPDAKEADIQKALEDVAKRWETIAAKAETKTDEPGKPGTEGVKPADSQAAGQLQDPPPTPKTWDEAKALARTAASTFFHKKK